uniref:Uncharacterized protein n=1 Tax=Romanomermis culicivorax TaxID=13658 RepID=A0A915KPQ8_ROMCU
MSCFLNCIIYNIIQEVVLNELRINCFKNRIYSFFALGLSPILAKNSPKADEPAPELTVGPASSPTNKSKQCKRAKDFCTNLQ